MCLLCRRRGTEDTLLLETGNTEGFGAAVDGELRLVECCVWGGGAHVYACMCELLSVCVCMHVGHWYVPSVYKMTAAFRCVSIGVQTYLLSLTLRSCRRSSSCPRCRHRPAWLCTEWPHTSSLTVTYTSTRASTCWLVTHTLV